MHGDIENYHEVYQYQNTWYHFFKLIFNLNEINQMFEF